MEITRLRKYQSQLLQEEHQGEAIKRVRKRLANGKRYATQPSGQISQMFELSEEEQAQVTSRDFRGEAAKAFLKDLVEKEEDQDLIGDEHLKVVARRMDRVMGLKFSRYNQANIAYSILFDLDRIEPGSRDDSIENPVIKNLLSIRKLHSEIARQVIENTNFRKEGGRRHFMSLEGLQDVLVNGMYRVFLLMGLNGRINGEAFSTLMESKKFQGRIASMIIQGFLARRSLEVTGGVRMPQIDVAQGQLQCLAAEMVLQSLLSQNPPHEGVAEKTLCELIVYGISQRLIGIKRFMEEVSLHSVLTY